MKRPVFISNVKCSNAVSIVASLPVGRAGFHIPTGGENQPFSKTVRTVHGAHPAYSLGVGRKVAGV